MKLLMNSHIEAHRVSLNCTNKLKVEKIFKIAKLDTKTYHIPIKYQKYSTAWADRMSTLQQKPGDLGSGIEPLK